MKELAKTMDELWMLLGDFNGIANGDESTGSNVSINRRYKFSQCS